MDLSSRKIVGNFLRQSTKCNKEQLKLLSTQLNNLRHQFMNDVRNDKFLISDENYHNQIFVEQCNDAINKILQ